MQSFPERPHILITNDDGVQSPGIVALKSALDPFGRVSVVAPDRNRTGAARSITMQTPLWVEEVELADGSIAFATDGTPVDCVRMAALGLLDSPPDLIVSGINMGCNLGDDITYSGTVAAAFEGIMLDIPAISLSAEGTRDEYDYAPAARFAAHLLGQLLRWGFPDKTLLNVNCPALPWERLRGAKVTLLGKRIYGDKVQLHEVQGRGKLYLMYGDDLSYHQEEGTDFEALADGYISVTPIHLELMNHKAFGELRKWDWELLPR